MRSKKEYPMSIFQMNWARDRQDIPLSDSFENGSWFFFHLPMKIKINTFYKPFKIRSMEVVTIEKRTFSYVCERFTEFAKRIDSLCNTHTQKVENWLDSQEVCLLLGFSKRTLQLLQK